MEVDIGKRNQKRIEENARETVRRFMAREDVTTKFGEPIFAYLSTTHPLFDTFFAQGANDHPKNIYRPGRTLIVHYVPIDEEVASSNREPGAPSSAWQRATAESLWLAMDINKSIRGTLDEVGRLHSATSSMVDWDMDRHRYGWSNKIAAYIAGLGEFGPAGSLHTKTGFAGRVGSVATDALYREEVPVMASEELQQAYETALRGCCFLEAEGVSCSPEMIAACPGDAITPEGIHRGKCQAYCATLSPYTPAPEYCGKCFRYR